MLNDTCHFGAHFDTNTLCALKFSYCLLAPPNPSHRKAVHQRYVLQNNLSVSSGNLAGQAAGGGSGEGRQASPGLPPPPPSTSLLPLLPATSSSSAPSTSESIGAALPGLAPAGSGKGPVPSGPPKFFVPGAPAAAASNSTTTTDSLYSSTSQSWGAESKRRSSSSSSSKHPAQQHRMQPSGPVEEPAPTLQRQPQQQQHEHTISQQQQQQQQQQHANNNPDQAAGSAPVRCGCYICSTLCPFICQGFVKAICFPASGAALRSCSHLLPCSALMLILVGSSTAPAPATQHSYD